MLDSGTRVVTLSSSADREWKSIRKQIKQDQLVFLTKEQNTIGLCLSQLRTHWRVAVAPAALCHVGATKLRRGVHQL